MKVSQEESERLIVYLPREAFAESDPIRADYVAAMQARIDEQNRLLQAIASELNCEPNSDILGKIEELAQAAIAAKPSRGKCACGNTISPEDQCEGCAGLA